jgi:RimJ/RimL family protein N-acetyltransferase
VFAGSVDVPGHPDGKLRLIKPSLAFAPVSLQWLRDPEVGQYMGADFSDVSIETEEQRIRNIQGGENTFGWMIELNGEVIGAIEVNQVEELSSEYMTKAGGLSILIGDKQCWGKRIATYAESAVLDWAFARGGFEVIVGAALVENDRSWRSLERLEFTFQRLRPDTLNGRTMTWRVYTMTRAQWQSLRAAR